MPSIFSPDALLYGLSGLLLGGRVTISGEIPKGTYLINNLTELPDKELLVATKEQFTVAINRAIFELGIYEQTISKK